MSSVTPRQKHSAAGVVRLIAIGVNHIYLGRLHLVRLAIGLFLLLTSAYLIGDAGSLLAAAAAKQPAPTPLQTFSAASYKRVIAPGSFAVSFGTRLAVGMQEAPNPFPEALLGTTVSIRDASGTERMASLTFVKPDQVNYLAPEGLSSGPATVTIRSGDGTVSTGTVEIAVVAPAIFTAKQDGSGIAAGYVLGANQRRQDLFEIVNEKVVSRAIDLGPDNEVSVLVMFLTGLGQAPNTDGNEVNGAAENVQVLIGGEPAAVLFAGKQGDFIGVDQINAVIPRDRLLDVNHPGSKTLDVVVKFPGAPDSNKVEFSIAPPQGLEPLQVTGFDGPSPAIANSEIQIIGSGISPMIELNRVAFGSNTQESKPGEVKEAESSRLTVTVPFGAVSGNISLNSDKKVWTSATPLRVRTSLSALVKGTDDQPLPELANAVVCAAPCASDSPRASIRPEGWFVLPDLSPGPARAFLITQPQSAEGFKIPDLPINTAILQDRDNHLPKDIFIQKIDGPSGAVGNGTGPAVRSSAASAPELVLSIDGFTFSVFDGANADFPNGLRRGEITLTPIRNSLTPVPLPPMIFSSAIAQVTPFGVKLAPGGKFIFPNRDRLTQAPNLYKFDLSDATFKDTGIQCRFTPDGDFIETPAGAITETSIYFVAVRKPTTTIAGRILDADGKTPVRGVSVFARGQRTSTDGNGGFILEGVPTGSFMSDSLELTSGGAFTNRVLRRVAEDDIMVRGSYLRPSGRTDTASRLLTGAIEDGITNLGAPLLLTASNSNRPPSLVVGEYLTIVAGEKQNYPVLVSDLDIGQSIARVEVAGASFATIAGNTGSYALVLSPEQSQVGTHILTVSADDSAGGSAEVKVTVIVTPSPNPSPIVADLDPEKVLRFRPELELAIIGANFVPGAIAKLDGEPLLTFFMSENSIRALIGPDDMKLARKRIITVVNPEPGGGISNEAEFIVANPVPTLTSLDPAEALRGSGPMTLTVIGTNFVPNSVVRWNGTPRATTFVSSTRVTAEIPASDLLVAGSEAITVFNPLPGGGTTTPLTFQIVFPAPDVTSASPAIINVDDETGIPGLPTQLTATLQIFGSGFVPETQIRIGTANQLIFQGVGTFVDQGLIMLTLPDAVNPPAGFYPVAAINPSPGGGESLPFAVVRFVKYPIITSSSFNYCVSGSTVMVTGTATGYGWEPGYQYFAHAYKGFIDITDVGTDVATLANASFSTPTTFGAQIEFSLAAISPSNQITVAMVVFPPSGTEPDGTGFIGFQTLTINPAQSCFAPLTGSVSSSNTSAVRVGPVRRDFIGRQSSSNRGASVRRESNNVAPPALTDRRKYRRPE